MKYQEERWTLALFEEAEALIDEHEKELNTGGFKPDCDVKLYIKASSKGLVDTYTVRTDEGELVGYMIYFVHRHPHYDLMVADADMLFLAAKCRGGMTGVKLITFSEKKLKAKGVEVVTQRTKRVKDLRRLFEHLGYGLHEEVYLKEL
jgi:hypothetical protein